MRLVQGKALLFTCLLSVISPGTKAETTQDALLPISIDLNILTSARYRAVRDGLVNPGNHLHQRDAQLETAAVIEGRAFDVRYRLRAPYTIEHIAPPAPNYWQTDHAPTLQELARDFHVGDDNTLTLGKTNLQWDTSYASHPLGFFDKDVDLSDIDDRLRRTEGQPMAALGHIGDGWDAMVVVAKDMGNSRDGYQRGLTQWALKGGAQIDATSLTGVVQQPVGERVGGGVAATHALGNDLEFHSSFFAREGTRRPIHKSLLTGELRYYAADEEPVDEFRRKDNQWYPRWVVGGQWTSDSLINVIMEWVHDSQGLSNGQWSTLKSLAQFHKAGGLGITTTAIEGNLGNDAKAFTIDGVRQDYLFLRLVKGGGNWEPSLSTLVGIADASASINARLTYAGARNWQAWVDGRINVGPVGSEFRSVPEAGFVGMTFRYIF